MSWFSKQVNKAKDGFNDAIGSVKKDPSRLLTHGFPMVTGLSVLDLGKRIRDDQYDQAKGMAKTDADRADRAAQQEIAAGKRREAAAIDASVKDIDPLAAERRRRAALATNKGRAGTDLTGGMSLGAADVQRKWLLGQ